MRIIKIHTHSLFNDKMVLKKSMMILFIALVGMLGAAIGDQFPTPEFVELLQPVVEKCETMTDVDKKLVEEFSKGTMHDDPKLKCYMKCIFLEFEVMDAKTGVLHYEKMLELIPESMKKIAFKMGKDCVHFKGEEGSDLCQVSYDLHRCWQAADPEHYFLM